MDPTTVPTWKRTLQITASIFFCFTIAGLVFGFAALKPILVDAGVYRHLCPTGSTTCKAQDTRLNLLFTVASSLTNVSALPMGAFLDHVGPRKASIFGGLLFGLGCGIFAISELGKWVDNYLVGYGLMAIGAPAMFLAQFHLSNAFPARSGLILGAITGAFDASSLPLCFFKISYFASGGYPTVKAFFLAYISIPTLLILHQLLLAPPTSYIRPAASPLRSGVEPAPATVDLPSNEVEWHSPFPGPSSNPDHGSSPSTSAISKARQRRMSSNFSRIAYSIHDDAGPEDEIKALAGSGQEGIVGAMFGKRVGGQVLSSWFWAMELMVMIHMTRINWYLATVSTQLVYYTGDDSLADTLTNAFIFLLPLGGILSIPAIGYLLDHRPTLDNIILMGVLGLLFGVLTLFPSTIPQLVGIGMLVIFRPFFYTAISDYAAKVFGFETFGTVYGLAMTLSGLFGLILTPLDLLTKGPLNGSFTPVNAVLAVLGVLTSGGLGWRVWTYTRAGRIRLGETRDTLGGAIVEEDEDEG